VHEIHENLRPSPKAHFVSVAVEAEELSQQSPTTVCWHCCLLLTVQVSSSTALRRRRSLIVLVRCTLKSLRLCC